jgi:hypothetical protein
MQSRLPGCRQGRACPCGAAATDGHPVCAKCAARGRWTRRKANRGFRDAPI